MSGGGLRDADGQRSRSFTYVTAIGAVLALLLICVSAAIAAQATWDQPGQAEPAAAPSQPAGVEVKSARTATSDTYALPDGSRETRIYQAPVNYRDGAGDWKPIREGFIENGSTIED